MIKSGRKKSKVEKDKEIKINENIDNDAKSNKKEKHNKKKLIENSK